ncbi:Translin-associated protein X [Sciurus carolinensis]|uniref:Translin-associated protein X n=1 Tax=Sciurus carolinensis TaxID=30640 RepID=A0AA41SR42_SCICA|nr:Translin-associated protein X [Sciurus carolinensis]
MSCKEADPGIFRKRKHDTFPHGQRREGKDVSSSSSMMVAFKAQELDVQHDNYERLVKLSRDITMESKRTIFLLHRITSAADMEEILTEPEVKLDCVRQKMLQVYNRFTFIGNTRAYEVSKKLYTLKQSLAKVENTCYALKVQGSKIPKHMPACVFSVKTEMPDQEEGIS